MYLSEDAFIESRAIRDRQLADIQGNRAEEILNRAKAILFAVWQDQGLATSEQVADFYEVTKSRRASRDQLEAARVAQHHSRREFQPRKEFLRPVRRPANKSNSSTSTIANSKCANKSSL